MEKWLNSAYTDCTKYFVSNPLPKKGEKIEISFRLLESAPVTNIFLRTKQNGVEILNEMYKDYVKNGLQYYKTSIIPYEDMLHYHIYMVTEDCIYYLTQRGITPYIPDETYDYKILINYQQPSWVKGSVFYQIFPDRFYNGNPDNDVKPGEYTFNGQPTQRIENWDTKPEPYTKSFCLDFYGGDLEGVKAKIPYLKRLGVTAIYLNPIFIAATVHKYDCLDYFTVDPHFGGDKALAELTDALHKEGMKLILDVSINHTGIAHKWFNKEATFFPKTQGAYNNPSAPEREFYFFDENNKYKAWFDVETLPTLNFTSQTLRDKLYRAHDSVVKKWLKPPYNIDGWRFDVADTMARNDILQLHHEVWPEIRKSVKEEKPDAYILGEDWTDCAEFLQGDEWDSSMNYFGCARPLREFAGEGDLFCVRSPVLRDKKYKPTAKHVAERIRSHLCKLPTVIQENQFNLLDSHDVGRLHNNKKIDPRHVRGAVIMMFCLPGTPNIYYGDEAGIDGTIETVEGCRYPMPWSRNFETEEPFVLYSMLSKLKTGKDALRDGGFKILHENDYVFAFARFTGESMIIAIFSTDDNAREIRIPLNDFGMQKAKGHEIFGNAGYAVEGADAVITVQPHESYLFEFC
ncbi:MAG: alpha-amylase family glycosyl hydrolase [Defluviitaleaceae bacterium]|nr:alpha-amylase family glycosyl hydrolase [Defluviitaleaceae bacterium]